MVVTVIVFVFVLFQINFQNAWCHLSNGLLNSIFRHCYTLEDADADVSCHYVSRNISVFIITWSASHRFLLNWWVSIEVRIIAGDSLKRAMSSSGRKVSMSFLSKYEKDSDTIAELCRVCLCRTSRKYVSIHAILPWCQQEGYSAQQFIEQILNREVLFIY